MSFSKKTALLIIDMQNRWVGSTKKLVPNWLDSVDTINRLREHWRQHSQPIFFVTLVHSPDGSTLSKFDSGVWNVQGSKDAEIIAELTPQISERVITKTRYSAFFGTALVEQMRQEEISACVITGYQARACILATALDAYQNDIQPIIVREAILETEKEYLDFYLKVFADADLLKSADEAVNFAINDR